MKEIIAEREKRAFLFITVVGLISTVGCIFGLIYIPSFFWLYLFGIVVIGFCTLVCAVGLCFPKWVIIREDDNIVIHNGFRGFRKVTYKITDIVGVEVQELKQQGNVKPYGNIVLTVKDENSTTKDILVINIKNKSKAVEKLNFIIQQSK